MEEPMAKRSRASKRSTPKEAENMVRVSTFLRRDQVEAMKAKSDESGVKPAEQIRRAIDAWLGERGRR